MHVDTELRTCVSMDIPFFRFIPLYAPIVIVASKPPPNVDPKTIPTMHPVLQAKIQNIYIYKKLMRIHACIHIYIYIYICIYTYVHSTIRCMSDWHKF